MKKLALILFISVQGILAKAQIAQDTVYLAIYQPGVFEVKDSIFNSSMTDSLTVTWSIPTANMSLQSGLSNIQVCDECFCYPTNLLPNQHTCKNYAPNKWGVFKMYVTVGSTTGVGTSYVTANTNLGNVTFAVITWPTNVRQLDQDVNISVYPNPTTGNVKVSFNSKNIATVNVLNVLGRKVAKYDVSKNAISPMNLSLDNLTAGVYLLQFTDANGKLLGVKRITKQ